MGIIAWHVAWFWMNTPFLPCWAKWSECVCGRGRRIYSDALQSSNEFKWLLGHYLCCCFLDLFKREWLWDLLSSHTLMHTLSYSWLAIISIRPLSSVGCSVMRLDCDIYTWRSSHHAYSITFFPRHLCLSSHSWWCPDCCRLALSWQSVIDVLTNRSWTRTVVHILCNVL